MRGSILFSFLHKHPNDLYSFLGFKNLFHRIDKSINLVMNRIFSQNDKFYTLFFHPCSKHNF